MIRELESQVTDWQIECDFCGWWIKRSSVDQGKKELAVHILDKHVQWRP